MTKIINTAYADFGGMGDQAGLIDHHFSMMGGYGSMGWFGLGFGWIFMLLVIALLVLGVIALAKYIKK